MLLTCSHCEGFVPANVAACPHCGVESLDVKTNSKFGALVKGVAAAATGGVVAITLMACYGAPEGDYDTDGDGFGDFSGDCNDGDPTIHPGAPDSVGDGVDQNCDGVDGTASEVDGGMSSSSSSGGPCITCNTAVNTTGLVAPAQPFCSTAGQQDFNDLKTCVCTDACINECGGNICQGMAATADCSTCVQANCATQNNNCASN